MEGLPVSPVIIESVGSAAKVLSAVYQLANGGVCFESQSLIAEIAGVSTHTVIRDIHGPLRDHGWLVYGGRQRLSVADPRKMRTVTVALTKAALRAMQECVVIPRELLGSPFSEQVTMAIIAGSETEWTAIPEIVERSGLCRVSVYRAVKSLESRHLVVVSEMRMRGTGDYFEMPCRFVAKASGARVACN